MRQVGELGFTGAKQKIRALINPLDKATIVSVFPLPITDVKHTIFPGKFVIPAGSYENPSRLVISPSSWWKEEVDSKPDIEVPISAVAIANSVIVDSCLSMIETRLDSMPGVFFIPGEIELSEIKSKYKGELEKAKTKQKAWFTQLVRIADGLWANSNGNPLVIANEMRVAALDLGLLDKPWYRDVQMTEMIKCPMCGALKHPDYPRCQQCQFTDLKHPKAKELGLIA